MSDNLSHILQSVGDWTPSRKEDPDQRIIDALDRALQATTPERPGCPWDEQEKKQENSSGYWLPEGE